MKNSLVQNVTGPRVRSSVVGKESYLELIMEAKGGVEGDSGFMVWAGFVEAAAHDAYP